MTLKEAVTKAQFVSEIDSGFELFEIGPSLDVENNRILCALALQPGNTKVENENLDNLLSENKELLSVIKKELDHFTAYQIGSINITYLIVGTNKRGNYVILRTKAVET